MTQQPVRQHEYEIVDDLDALLAALPRRIASPVYELGDRHELLEIVLDLGRRPEARLARRELELSDLEVTFDDLQYVVEHVGEFGDDNRAGIPRTLHRISAIRNRAARVVGLTCRIGRAVFGTIYIIRDIVESGRSILLLGRPGVGKTTMLREVARVLADDFRKRVVIVDTSNEIAGDGDIPHPAIGRARRMQVPTPTQQHAVMIEAVENHMPEVIIIDEIGTELEAVAARTIAERGVQLVATAHGNTLENLILNPTLSDLIGGIQTVTLSDEEARRRGTQKSVLERKAPPTFDALVEIQAWDRVAVHDNVAETVDALLRGQAPRPELRFTDDQGELRREAAPAEREGGREDGRLAGREGVAAGARGPQRQAALGTGGRMLRIYPYGVSHNRLEQAIRELHVPAQVTRNLRDADAVMTLKNYYRRKPTPIRDAESAAVPIFVLKNNTVMQMQQSIASMYDLDVHDPVEQAMDEAEAAAQRALTSEERVELTPQNAFIRRLQHQLAERYSLTSRSVGREPFRRVEFFRERA
ncbi:MAG: AAA family ATPase [Chloroflexi bacterium]|nr:AAA family ATPase [Chloroflexota bacterium]